MHKSITTSKNGTETDRLNTDRIKNAFIVIMVTYLSWISYNSLTYQDRLFISPFAYRMNWHLTNWLSGFVFSQWTWFSVTWILSIVGILILYKDESAPALLLWVIGISVFGAIYDGPAFLLLAIMIKYHDRPYVTLLLIPIVLFKEVVALIGLLYVLLYTRHRIAGSVSFVIAGSAYCLMRFMIVGNIFQPMLFTYPIIIEKILHHWFTILPMTILLIYLTFRKEHLNLWILAAIPIFIFAIFYEPQLWFPLIIIQEGRFFTDSLPIAGKQELG